MASLTFQLDIHGVYPRTSNCINDIAFPQIHSRGTGFNTGTERVERGHLEPQVDATRRGGVSGGWREKNVGELRD